MVKNVTIVNRDTRYDTIKHLITEGKIRSFNDIFKYVPKTIVANDLGKKVDRFTELMNRVEGFTLAELFMIAKFCEINENQIFSLVMSEYKKNKSKILKSLKSL